jgi:hypothetical protein
MNGSHAVLANLRAWWKEGIGIGLSVLAGFTNAGPSAGVAVFLVLLAGWAIGFSHRHGPIWETIRRMDGKLDQALAPADQPVAKVRHLRGL